MAGSLASRAGRENPKLTAVGHGSDERTYLYELIQTIGAGPDLEAILRGVVRLVTEARECHACFVYFVGEGSLTLRAASQMYEHLESQVHIPIGEGLTGWVAKTRRSAFIKEKALEDPRVRRAYFPELGDEVYESLVSVPIFARDGDVIGVITLHAEAPHEFHRADLDFLEHTASLIAGAVENARLYEEATARVTLLSALSEVAQRITRAGDEEQLLEVVADGVRDLIGADRCEIYLMGPGEQLRLAAAHPARAATTGRDTIALAELGGETHTLERAHAARVGHLLWGGGVEGTIMVVPLVAGEEPMGLIAILARGPSEDAETAIAGIAAHTAVALQQHQVIQDLREQNLLKDFFQALARGDAVPEVVGHLASRLDCDLDAPHLVLHVIPWPPGDKGSRVNESTHRFALGWAALAGQVEARLAARFPGILVDRLERSLRGLLPLAGLSLEETAEALSRMDWGDDPGPGLSVGASNPCGGLRSYARGFAEAESAADIGGLIRGGPGVAAYDELGPYRYLLESDIARDRLQQKLELLIDYDRRRGTQLLDTLEGYLNRRGNFVGTSKALFIHPNTLRQRLARIERVSGIDIEHGDWLSLAVATKIVKLRRTRRSASGEGGSDG